MKMAPLSFFARKGKFPVDNPHIICYNKFRSDAAMAQSVEHILGKDEVISSILISSSRKIDNSHKRIVYFFLFTSIQNRR